MRRRLYQATVLALGLGILAGCAPRMPGESLCLDGEDCDICIGWDCANSFIDASHSMPLSPDSRAAVAACYAEIDPTTRNLADGHTELLARKGPLTWGPARRWTYLERSALGDVESMVRRCMEDQGWVYCCKGGYCSLRPESGQSGKWYCARRP